MDRTLYDAGATRVAMREGDTLYYLLGDHLGSTALTLTSSGAPEGEVRYGAWGADRYTSGTTTHTTYRYTGQRNESGLGLYYYGARWYDAALGRFIQADSIIPGAGNVQAWDRYAGMFNNPLRYTDPSGHNPCGDAYDEACAAWNNEWDPNYQAGWGQSIPTVGVDSSYSPTIESSMGSDTLQTPTPEANPGITFRDIPEEYNPDAELLRHLRALTGEIDPGVPDAFTGTGLGYRELIEQAATALNNIAPGNPYSEYTRAFVPVVWGLSHVYNVTYDLVTDTGPYSTLPKPTPIQWAQITIAVLIAIPILPPPP